MVTDSRGSVGLKIMIEEKKSGIFLTILNFTEFLSKDLKPEAQN